MESTAGSIQSHAERRTRRTYFADPGLARRIDELNAGIVDDARAARHDNILYDSETAKSTSYYAEDHREQVHELMTVVQVRIAAWTELVIRPGAAEGIRAILWLINKPEREWTTASTIARDLLAYAELAEIHAISVPIQHGRLLWIPSLSAVCGLITIGDSKRVRITWGGPPAPRQASGLPSF
jgi:hypothetical protein